MADSQGIFITTVLPMHHLSLTAQMQSQNLCTRGSVADDHRYLSRSVLGTLACGWTVLAEQYDLLTNNLANNAHCYRN